MSKRICQHTGFRVVDKYDTSNSRGFRMKEFSALLVSVNVFGVKSIEGGSHKYLTEWFNVLILPMRPAPTTTDCHFSEMFGRETCYPMNLPYFIWYSVVQIFQWYKL